MRFRPETTGALPPTYLSVMRSVGCPPSWASITSSMKPSSLRMRAIWRFVREAGTTTSVWRARLALRMRVSMSAIGSETFMCLPARLRHARQLTQQGALPEADAAEGETAHEGGRAAADGAAGGAADRELGRPLRLRGHGFLGHRASPA